MTEKDRERLERLEANLAELSELANSFEEDSGLAEGVGVTITHDYEDTDFAQLLSDRDISDRLVQLLGENREQVERALERLAEGNYGVCEDCGERIVPERLRFKPEATRCVSCQARWDRVNRRTA